MDDKRYLSDQEFLLRLQKQSQRETYARITALNKDEYPIEQVQGKVTSGSINIDGASAVRRTCSLSISLETMEITDYIWTLKTKFFLEIGVKNTIEEKYPSIIWIPQGIFVISTFSSSLGLKNLNINISGKDKMCLLNGEMGGIIQDYIVNLSSIDEYDDLTGEMVTRDLTIREIIISVLTTYGHEKIENIFIEDLEDYGTNWMEYRGEEELYLYSEPVSSPNLFSNNYINIAFPDTKVIGDIQKENGGGLLKYGEIDEYIDSANNPHITRTYVDLDMYYTCDYEVNDVKWYYQIKKIEFGETVGHTITELTYPGAEGLKVQQGNSVTTVLDKLKNMLKNFEYFYNEYGKFIFRQKQIFKNSTLNSIVSQSPATINYSDVNLELTDLSLIQSFSTTPNLANVKNDYSIWGLRKSIDGNGTIPIHFRFAIDKKPTAYKSVNDKKEILYSTDEYDWREILYQMASDYMKKEKNFKGEEKEYERLLMERNSQLLNIVNGKTGYEQYYTDIYSFWRDLYDPASEKKDYEVILNPKASLKNLYAQGYAVFNKDGVKDKEEKEIMPSLSSFFSQGVDTMDHTKLKVFKHNGFQNLMEVLSPYKASGYRFYLGEGKTRLLDMPSQDLHLLDIANIPKGKSAFYIKGVNDKRLNVFGQETIPQLYQKNNNGTFSELSFKSHLNDGASIAYYFKNGTYTRVDELLIELGEKGTLYLFSGGDSLTPKNHHSLAASGWDATAKNNRESITYYIPEKEKFYPWWQAYKDDNLSTMKIYYETPWAESEEVGQYLPVKGTESTPLMNKIYILSDGTLRKSFYKFDFDLKGNAIPSSKKTINISYYKGIDKYWGKGISEEDKAMKYWNKAVTRNPNGLNFWIDFLDPTEVNGVGAEIDKFSVSSIGIRPFMINDGENANAVFYTRVPNLVFHEYHGEALEEWEKKMPGYSFIHMEDYTKELFVQSTRRKSLQDVLDENLFKHSYCADSATISMLPLLHIQPNIKILLEDQTSKISSIYELTKFSIPLESSRLSNLTLSKYVEQLY